jgi:hypothetical protein
MVLYTHTLVDCGGGVERVWCIVGGVGGCKVYLYEVFFCCYYYYYSYYLGEERLVENFLNKKNAYTTNTHTHVEYTYIVTKIMYGRNKRDPVITRRVMF